MAKDKMKSELKRSIKEDSDIKCYFCGSRIESVSKLLYVPIMVMHNGKIQYPPRAFHRQCVGKYEDLYEDLVFREKEQSDWDKVYAYFQKEYLNTDKPLGHHAVMRLLGLRVGKFYPNGDNTRILKRGYSFFTIHKAMIVAKSKAKDFVNKIDIKDESHLINVCMKFIVSEVDDVQYRIDKQAKSDIALDRAILNKEDESVIDYRAELIEDIKKRKAELANKEVEKPKGKTLAEIFGWEDEGDEW